MAYLFCFCSVQHSFWSDIFMWLSDRLCTHTESNPALAIYEYFDSVRSATVLDDLYGCSYVTPGPLQTIPIQSRHYSVPGYLSTNFICYSFVTLIRRTINSNQIHHHLPKFYHHLYWEHFRAFVTFSWFKVLTPVLYFPLPSFSPAYINLFACVLTFLICLWQWLCLVFWDYCY